MPNWVYNELKVSRKVWDAIKAPYDEKKHYDGMKNKDGYTFDFNAIIPMPEELADTTSGGNEWDAVVAYLSKKHNTTNAKELFGKEKNILLSLNMFFSVDSAQSCLNRIATDNETDLNEHILVGEKYVNLYEKYGACDWYKWSCENWGTKWNACDVCIDESSEDSVLITFNTAWDPPYPIYEKIAELFPEEETCGYCEEEGDCFEPFEWEIHNGQVYSWGVPHKYGDDEEAKEENE